MYWLAVALALGMQLTLPDPKPDLHLAAGVLAARALDRPTAGISIAISRGPFSRIERAFGFADIANKVAVAIDTVFRAPAVSNYIDAAIVMKLVEEGKLALDEVRPLLMDFSADSARLRAVIERVTGQPYAQYASSSVFVRLRMTSTSICAPGVMNAAAGYTVKSSALAAVPSDAGHVCTTARDLLTFESAINSARFISRASVATMRTATGMTQGHRVAGRAGSSAGFSAALFTYPDDNLTIVVLANTDNGAAAALAAAIARSAFEVGPPLRDDTAVPPAEAAALAGTFESASGSIEISRCSAKLCARTPDGVEPAELRRQGPNVYALDGETELRFQNSGEWLLFHVGGLPIDAKRRVRSR